MNRTVIITGGTKGLGREMALAFGRAGHFVVALYSSDETAAQELSELGTENKIHCAVVRHDIRSEDALVWSRPEIQEADKLTLVHNACATFSPVPMHQLKWQDFENNFQTAIKGAWQCSLPLIRLMLKKGGGTIVNILTSAIEGAPPKGFAAYVTAKHALQGFTLALAAEYGGRGIKVFGLSPGYMETPLTLQWDARLRDAIRGAGRVTLPTEAAARVVALVEDAGTPGRGESYPV